MSNSEVQSSTEWASLARSLVQSLSQSRADDSVAESERIAETCAAAFASGFTRGCWGKVEIGGVPFDLAAGVLLHLVGWSGVAREQSRGLHHLAEGALATYFATWGATIGKRVRQGEQIVPEPNAWLRALDRNGDARAQGSVPETNGSLSAADSELLELIRTMVPS